MLNRFLVFASAPIVGFLLAGGALADEPLVRESRPIANVTAVSLRNSGDLFITQGDREELIVEAQKALLPKILTEVEKGTLVLSMKPSAFHVGMDAKIKFYLTSNDWTR